MNKDIAVIILAAGKGERMKSEIPKVLHPICGRPMLGYVLDLARALKPRFTCIVLGHKSDLVRDYIKTWRQSAIKIVIQRRLLGSADAVKQASSVLRNFKGIVLVLYADNPLIKLETLKRLIGHHQKSNAEGTLLSAILDKPTGYGRVVRDKFYSISKIVEEKDTNDYQRDIKEIATGIFCFNREKLFAALKKVKPNPIKKEYYLTDVVGILYKQKADIGALKLEDPQEGKGINSQEDLSRAEKIMQARFLKNLMDKGVRIINPDSTFVSWDTCINKGSVVFPFTVIENNVKIGKDCRIGPFCHLREGTVIRDGAFVGNFSELVRSKVGERTRARHFCYLGDSRIGKQVNIGAGTVTANFDGKKKNVTVIKDNAFIGSDTVLVAPVRVGRKSITGAGSVVTKNKNVPDNTTVVGVPARPLKKKKPELHRNQ